MKKFLVILVILVLIAGLYFIEISKIDSKNEAANAMPTLDELEYDEAAVNWEDFYKVRATIIDGQRAEFDIPETLKKKEGSELELTGAVVFFSSACKKAGDKIAIDSYFIYPSLGLANACIHLPEVAMRWTVRINLKEDWIASREDMIDVVVKVKGIFRIDTDKPYEAVFYLEEAEMEIIPEEEVIF